MVTALPVIVLAVLAALGIAGLWAMAVRDRRTALRQHAALLDALAGELANGTIRIGADGFPALSGELPDGRAIDVALVADTLQFRRLPQLWLKVTIREVAPRPWPTIGALARPTGAEFYSLTAGFPERLSGPSPITDALLVRGDGKTRPQEIDAICTVFGGLFEDSGLKEVAMTPLGIRIVRQAAEGDRGAHLLLRQVRFPVIAVPPALLRRCLADAAALRRMLSDGSTVSEDQRRMAS